jgi:hypothetical protein
MGKMMILVALLSLPMSSWARPHHKRTKAPAARKHAAREAKPVKQHAKATPAATKDRNDLSGLPGF